MIHLPILTISFPANVLFFYRIGMNFVQFDLLPSATIYDYMFDFGEEQPYNDNFDQIDYSNMNLI